MLRAYASKTELADPNSSSSRVLNAIAPLDDPRAVEPDPELKLPKRSSLVIMILNNCLLQMSFFIIVSSSNEYAKHLGGDSTFSGIVIGIPTVVSGLTLLPMMHYDKGEEP
jgi:hypothetical protein